MKIKIKIIHEAYKPKIKQKVKINKYKCFPKQEHKIKSMTQFISGNLSDIFS